MRKLTFAAILAAGLGLAVHTIRPSSATTGRDNAARASAGSRELVAAGKTEPASEEIDVSVELAGKLRRVAVEEGQSVRRGQVIAELENADFAARVELARATVAEREAALARARNGSRPMQRRESAASVREAEAVLDNARAERDRRASLLERGAISRSEFDVADREYRVAQARVDAARERTALVEDETRPEDIERALAELAQARARQAEAEAMLAKTVVRAPIDGVVLRRHKQAGETASPELRLPVVTLGDTRRMNVRAEIDETDVASIRVGQQGWVTAAGFGDRRFPVRVVRVGRLLGRKKVATDDPAAKVDTNVLEALLELEDASGLPAGLRVDAYVRVR